jgi:DNA-binding transcriptional LysR family regulator
MELTPLRYFRAIGHAGHMTKAARALGVSQPALSAVVKKLETEVGAPLLNRTGRGVELTEAGRVFLEHAEGAIRQAEGAIGAVRQLVGLERGSIRVGGGATATTYLLPPVVSSVLKKHPGLRFYVREAGSSAVAGAVASGELDLGVVTLPVKDVESERLVRVPLVEDELRLILPKGKDAGERVRSPERTRGSGAKSQMPPLAGGLGKGAKAFSWSELAGVPIVAFEAGTAVRDMIDRASRDADVTLNVVMELRSIESIKQMVQAGIGAGFVSKFALDAGEGLACRQGKLSRQLAIVKRRDRPLSPAATAFERQLLTMVTRGSAETSAGVRRW